MVVPWLLASTVLDTRNRFVRTVGDFFHRVTISRSGHYVAVHAIGPVEVIEEAARLHALVSRLTDRHEAARAEPWAVKDAPEPFVVGQLQGIVGVALRIETLIGKRKLSQNRPEADREGVRAGLSASADPADRAVAAAMRPA